MRTCSIMSNILCANPRIPNRARPSAMMASGGAMTEDVGWRDDGLVRASLSLRAFRPNDLIAADVAADLATAWVDGRDAPPLCDTDCATARDSDVASHDGNADCDALDMNESSQGSDGRSV